MAIENEENVKVEGSEREERENSFDRLMFGPKKEAAPYNGDRQTERHETINQPNLEELITQIDTLIESAKQLKPMFHNLRPFIDQFIKKKK